LGFNTYRLAFFWRGLSLFITFFAVVVGWVFFRAADFEAAVIMLQGMSGLNGDAIPNGIAVRLGSFQEILSNMGVDFYLGGGAQFVLSYFWVISLLVVALCAPNTQQIMVNFAPAFNVFGSSLSDSIRVGGRLVIN
jgi:hypothetical protein